MVEIRIDEFSRNFLSGWVKVEPDAHFPRLKLYMNDQLLGEIHRSASQPQDATNTGWTHFHYAFELDESGLLCRVPQNAVFRLVRGCDGSLIREIIVEGKSSENRFTNSFGEGYALYHKASRGFVVPLKERRNSWWASAGKGLKSLFERANAAGYDLQIAYGSLLGCIREKSFIPHDDDIDLVLHCGEQDNAVTAAMEFRTRLYTLAGQNPVRMVTNGQAHINFERDVIIDIFAAWTNNGEYFQNFTIAGGISVHSVLPSRAALFMGVKVMLPHLSDDVLEAIYGPDWKVPDPSFKWNRPAYVETFFGLCTTTPLKLIRLIGRTTTFVRIHVRKIGFHLPVSSLLLHWTSLMKAIV